MEQKYEQPKIDEDEQGNLVRAAVEAAREDLLAFCMFMDPNFVVGPHQRLMADKLMDLFWARITRLMIFMPPRSGKSYVASKYFPLWCLGHVPGWQIITASHSANLAEDFSREVRNLVSSNEFQLVFPGVTLRPDSRAANRWHTNGGGIYTAIGVEGKFSGRGANVAGIDDPISEQEAYSKAKRERVNKWYPGGLRSRLMPNGRIYLVTTRWHETDLAGFLEQQMKHNPDADDWEIIKIPALLDEESVGALSEAREKCIVQGILPPDYPEMKVDETYWPVTDEVKDVDQGLRGWTTEELLKTKLNMPPHEWEALYMQRPSAEEGNILKRRWWRSWTKTNPPKCQFVFMSVDTAYSERDSADYSAITTWGVFRAEESDEIMSLIMLGAQKGRWEFPELRRKVTDLYSFHQPDVILVEKKASGQSLIQDLRHTGAPVMAYPPDRDKVARAYACTPLFNSGRVWAPVNKQWAEEVMFECSVFPAGTHDDYVDTVTQAILWSKEGSWLIHPDDEWQYRDDYGRIGNRRKFYF